jgi:hypothetical protein
MQDATETLTAALRYAVLAPSSHNSQPWSFRLNGNEVELWADRTRALPVVDPDDRELLISCGAALHHLRVALAAAGTEVEVERLPEPLLHDFLARVTVREVAIPDPAAIRLRDAMTWRHTTRGPFDRRPAPINVVQRLQRASRAQGAELWVIGDRDRDLLLHLIGRGARLQGASRELRHELATWIRSAGSRQRDGMPGRAFGLGPIRSTFWRALVRTVDWGERQAARDRALVSTTTLLAVIGTAGDTPASWLAAGEALSAVLLEAAYAGVSASFLNQVVEVPALRAELAERAPADLVPQLVLRLGYHRGRVRATRRRPLDELMI